MGDPVELKLTSGRSPSPPQSAVLIAISERQQPVRIPAHERVRAGPQKLRTAGGDGGAGVRLTTIRQRPPMNIDLSWTLQGRPPWKVDDVAHMAAPGTERLELSYGAGAVRETVRLCHSMPTYGGKRWWMICPYRGARVNKLYLPAGGDRFASRQAWRLGYRSELVTEQARALDRLFALQRKLGCAEGLGVFPTRPRRMWQRTYERHLQRYWELQDAAHSEMLSLASRFMV